MAKKRRTIDIIGAFVIALGVAMLLYPTISNMITKMRAAREITAYGVFADDGRYTEERALADRYNRAVMSGSPALVPESDSGKALRELLDSLDGDMLGYVSIPAIDEELPVYPGTSENSLQSGTGWWVGTSLPSNDAVNCVITAHSGLLKASFFTNLDRLTIGDTFTIKMFGASYVYTVDLIDITAPDDTEFLTVPDGKSHATLYTCTPVGENTHRLIVRGTLMKNPGNETDTAIGADDNTTGRLIAGMSTLAFIIVLGIWMAAIIVRAKKDRKARRHKR